MMSDTPQDRVDFENRVMAMAIEAIRSKPETKHESWLIGIFCLCATALAITGIVMGADFQITFSIWAGFVGTNLIFNAGFRTVKKVQELKNGAK